MTRTFSPKPADVQRDWLVIDATDVVLGRSRLPRCCRSPAR